MNKQIFRSLSASTKNTLVKTAKQKGYKHEVKRLNRNCFDVTIYCSSEALEDL